METKIEVTLDMELGGSRKKTWAHRQCHLAVPAHTSAAMQLTLLGIIFFCGSGVFAALAGLGGGGLGDPIPVSNSLVATYATLAVIGFFSGPVCAKIGFRMSLLLGSIGFTSYSALLLVYKHTQTGWVLILDGVLYFLGCCGRSLEQP